MRLNKSDLDDSVVEDGENVIISKGMKSVADGVTDTKYKTITSRTYPDNCSQHSENVVSGYRFEKSEPVENTEENDDVTCYGEEDQDIDIISSAVKGCFIASSSEEKSVHSLEEKLLGMKLEENEKEDARISRKLTKQVSVVTVDPPNLCQDDPPEDEGEEGVLQSRGPVSGIPTNFHPGNSELNRVANNSYGTHNLNRFCTSQHGLYINDGYHSAGNQSYTHLTMPDPMVNSSSSIQMKGMLPNYVQYNNVNQNIFSGKRRPDDDMDTQHYKYTRPVEPCQPQQLMNNLNLGSKHTITQVHPCHGSGAQVIDNSPDILSPSKDFSALAYPPLFETQLSNSTVDSILDVVTQLSAREDQAKGKMCNYYANNMPALPGLTQTLDKNSTVYEMDAGYASENSPHSDMTSSPGSSPKSRYSPPPSNYSHDSGIASPLTDDAMSVTMPSPASSGRRTASPHAVSSHPSSVSSFAPGSPNEDGFINHYAPSAEPNWPAAYMSPLHSENYPVPSVSAVAETNIDDFFVKHREDLKDALEVVARDMLPEANKRQPLNSFIPERNQIITSSSGNTPTTVLSPAAPILKTKLPLPPLPAAPRPLQPQPVSTSISSISTPVTSQQPVQLILVVQQKLQQPPPSSFKKFVHIQPKKDKALSATSSSPSAIPSDSSSGARAVMTSKPSGSVPSIVGQGDSFSGVRAQQSVNQCIPADLKRNPCAGKKKIANVQQPRMLNVARRLVASMTKEDLMFQDGEGDTYLHVSVCKADCNMVQALLERLQRENLRSMVNKQNSMRQTPLYLAVSSNHPEMVVLMIQYGADVNTLAEHTLVDGKSKEMKAAIHCAASNGDQYLVTLQALLTSQDLTIDLVNSDGHTALHCAILEHNKPRPDDTGRINNLPIIQALIKHGADPNAEVRKSGKTALMYALESKDIVLIEHIVALIDPARLKTFLRKQTFDGNNCLRIAENIQRTMDPETRQRLMACLEMNSSRRDPNLL